jgi:hypothetical protein
MLRLSSSGVNASPEAYRLLKTRSFGYCFKDPQDCFRLQAAGSTCMAENEMRTAGLDLVMSNPPAFLIKPIDITLVRSTIAEAMRRS